MFRVENLLQWNDGPSLNLPARSSSPRESSKKKVSNSRMLRQTGMLFAKLRSKRDARVGRNEELPQQVEETKR